MFSSQRLLNLWMTHIWSSTADDITVHLTVLLPGAVYPALYLSSYRTYRNTFQLVLSITYMPWRAQEHLWAFMKGCKLEKIPYILQRVNMWHILESKLPLGGYFSWSNLKCSCWDGGIKVRASSLIWFFKLLQRESRVKEAYGDAWDTESSFFSWEELNHENV